MRKAIRSLSEWDIWMRIISVMYSRNDLACHRRSTGHSIRISKKKIGEMEHTVELVQNVDIQLQKIIIMEQMENVKIVEQQNQ